MSEAANDPIDEGYVKYECEWLEGAPPAGAHVSALAAARNRLRALGLIGEYPDGIGFGNVSVRAGGRGFIITGTQTGGVPAITPAHMTLVTDVDIDRNRLRCVGPVRASSESLTHAAIYECSARIGAVVHVHDLASWSRLRGVIPTTREDVPYGTPAMARELARLYRESDLPAIRVAAMAGHREGIIGFGETLDEAVAAILATTAPSAPKR